MLGLFALPAVAALEVRPGGMVHDTATGLTWIQDLKLAAGSSFDDGLDRTDGRMSWANARAWAAGLVFGGRDDWRLPTLLNPVPGCTTACARSSARDHSELSMLYQDALGNLPGYLPDGSARPGVQGVDWGLRNTGPFLNLRPDGVWLDPTYYEGSDVAWEFWAPTGLALVYYKHFEFQAWAVRDGDVTPVPAPAAGLSMAAGLLLLLSAAAARRAGRAPGRR